MLSNFSYAIVFFLIENITQNQDQYWTERRIFYEETYALAYSDVFPILFFANIGDYDKYHLAEVLQTYKDFKMGESIDLNNTISEIVGVFKHEAPEEEESRQAAMLAAATRYEKSPARNVQGHWLQARHQEQPHQGIAKAHLLM